MVTARELALPARARSSAAELLDLLPPGSTDIPDSERLFVFLLPLDGSFVARLPVGLEETIRMSANAPDCYSSRGRRMTSASIASGSIL